MNVTFDLYERLKIIKKYLWLRWDVGGFGSKLKGGCVWLTLVNVFDNLHDKHIIHHSFLYKRIENDSHNRFWDEVWLGKLNQFPMFYALEMEKKIYSY